MNADLEPEGGWAAAAGRAHGDVVLFQTRFAAVAAAWEVWGESQHEVRRQARTNEWCGDLPDAAQRRMINEQYTAQIFEAYARARLQCAIVAGVDGLDMVAEFDRHWVETWGDSITGRVVAAYAARIASAGEGQSAARVAATQQALALEAAGVRSDLPPRRPPSALERARAFWERTVGRAPGGSTAAGRADRRRRGL